MKLESLDERDMTLDELKYERATLDTLRNFEKLGLYKNQTDMYMSTDNDYDASSFLQDSNNFVDENERASSLATLAAAKALADSVSDNQILKNSSTNNTDFSSFEFDIGDDEDMKLRAAKFEQMFADAWGDDTIDKKQKTR